MPSTSLGQKVIKRDGGGEGSVLSPVWLLSTGIWQDEHVWIDTEFWKDSNS